MSQKTPKFIVLTAGAIVGWLLPVAVNLPKSVQGFGLSVSFVSALAVAVESRKESTVEGISKAHKNLALERQAYELSFYHHSEIEKLKALYGFDEDEPDYDRSEYHQPQLDGATIDQKTIVGSGNRDTLWHIDRLLENNSSHVLLIGQTGSGKTTLARWLISQLKSDKTIVLDADDDGQTWGGFTTIGKGDDWEAIDKAMAEGLEEFTRRTPNGNNPQTVYVLEELPDLISECSGGVDFCNRLLRRGRKRKQFIIALTQDPNTGTIGLSQPVQKCFTRVYLGGMGRYALKNLVPRGQRETIATSLTKCSRPAVVEFLGEWFAWDVPNLTPSAPAPNTAPTTPAPNGTIAPTTAPNTAPSIAPNTTPSNGTIASLNKCLAAKIDVTLEHWAIVDFAKSQGGWVSARETMRAISKIKSADQCKSMFRDLQALELGETATDDRYPDRLLFKAY